MKPKYKDYVVAMSFKNYLEEKTGLPKVMLAHQEMYQDEGVSYVGLFWVRKRKLHEKILLYSEVGLILDGQFRGVYHMSQLVNLFADWCRDGHRIADIHIHHMMFAQNAQIHQLLGTFYDVPIKVYLHDYYNACANFTLLREGKTYCGGKGLGVEACKNCSSYASSCREQKRIHTLFDKYISRITFISPSRVTREIFLRFHPEHEERTIVIPHQTFHIRHQGNLGPVAEDEKIRVAYLGMPVYHKGWDTWKRLAQESPSDQYTFIVFNSADADYSGMEKVNVCFSDKDLNAMTAALRQKKVHLAIMWSMWPETYSYTCFEAYSSNAMLITRTDSGNMEDMVRDYNCGIVLESEDALIELFRDPQNLRNKINEYRANALGGPENMEENREIVEITKASAPEGRAQYKKLLCPVNYPLLYWLNRKHKQVER